MERKGYKRLMENIQNRGPNLKFDVWHFAKSITKTLTERQRTKNVAYFSPGSRPSLTI
ncbi:unnamed protein product, partial [Porites evermanni]